MITMNKPDQIGVARNGNEVGIVFNEKGIEQCFNVDALSAIKLSSMLLNIATPLFKEVANGNLSYTVEQLREMAESVKHSPELKRMVMEILA